VLQQLDGVAGAVLGGRVVCRAGDMCDPGASGRQQMLDGQLCATAVVRHDGDVVRVRGRRERVDRRDRLDALQGRPRVGAAAGDDDAVHPPVHEVAQMMLLADGVPAGVAQQHRDLPGAERVLGAEQDGGAEAADAVGRHQPDGPAAARVQALRVLVGTEVELLHGGQDPLPCLGPHPAVAVERLGGRSDTDAGQLGHIGELCPSGGRGIRSSGHAQSFS